MLISVADVLLARAGLLVAKGAHGLLLAKSFQLQELLKAPLECDEHRVQLVQQPATGCRILLVRCVAQAHAELGNGPRPKAGAAALELVDELVDLVEVRGRLLQAWRTALPPKLILTVLSLLYRPSKSLVFASTLVDNAPSGRKQTKLALHLPP